MVKDKHIYLIIAYFLEEMIAACFFLPLYCQMPVNIAVLGLSQMFPCRKNMCYCFLDGMIWIGIGRPCVSCDDHGWKNFKERRNSADY